MFFRPKAGGGASVGTSLQTVTGIDPRALRRIKILAGLTDEQLTRFAEFMEVEKVPQWSIVVKQGEHGNTMFLILEGELRVRITTMGKETILTTLTIGDFFGDISLFDHGPRAADVVANADSLLLKLLSCSPSAARSPPASARITSDLAIPSNSPAPRNKLAGHNPIGCHAVLNSVVSKIQ
jgi:hypothetical protein